MAGGSGASPYYLTPPAFAGGGLMAGGSGSSPHCPVQAAFTGGGGVAGGSGAFPAAGFPGANLWGVRGLGTSCYVPLRAMNQGGIDAGAHGEKGVSEKGGSEKGGGWGGVSGKRASSLVDEDGGHGWVYEVKEDNSLALVPVAAKSGKRGGKPSGEETKIVPHSK